jgi:hypothetical protein
MSDTITLKQHYNFLQKYLVNSEADNQYFNSLDEIYITAKTKTKVKVICLCQEKKEKDTLFRKFSEN